MVKYNRIFLNFVIVASAGAAFLCWGIIDNGWFKIIIAIIILFIALVTLINEIHFKRDLDKWLRSNQERSIFYFASKKKVQNEIMTKIIPNINPLVYQVYYEGPKLRGDLKTMHIIELMNIDKRIKPHHPSLIKVKEQGLEILSLIELNTENLSNENANLIIDKINEHT